MFHHGYASIGPSASGARVIYAETSPVSRRLSLIFSKGNTPLHLSLLLAKALVRCNNFKFRKVASHVLTGFHDKLPFINFKELLFSVLTQMDSRQTYPNSFPFIKMLQDVSHSLPNRLIIIITADRARILGHPLSYSLQIICFEILIMFRNQVWIYIYYIF